MLLLKNLYNTDNIKHVELCVSNISFRTAFGQKYYVALPWLMDLISIVLGMRSSAVPITDFRLTLDLKRVFISVDLPKPL